MINWQRVKAGEAVQRGVNSPEAGWIGASDAGLYFVWCQARPRDEGPFYAAARVSADGKIERYGGLGDGPRPSGVVGSWLCNEGSLADAKGICRDDIPRRSQESLRAAVENVPPGSARSEIRAAIQDMCSRRPVADPTLPDPIDGETLSAYRARVGI